MTRYTISQASELTDIPAETIRMWERRYGVPSPARTPSGHRRYSDEQIEWLRLVRRVVESGVQPSKAVRMDRGALEAACPTPPVALEPSPELERLVSSVNRLDGAAFVTCLDDLWHARSPLQYAAEIAAPLMDTLARGLESGVLTERQVTYACRVFEDHLRARATRFVAAPGAPRVLLTSTVDDGTRARMQLAALLCAAAGAAHANLAPGKSVTEAAEAVAALHADTLAVCVPVVDERVREITDRMRGALPKAVHLVVMGARARAWRGDVEVLGGHTEWAAWLRGRTPADQSSREPTSARRRSKG